MNEFNGRAEIARIDALEASPLRKARLLLGLANRMRPAMLRLALLGEHYEGIGEAERAVRFREARQRMRDVHDEARACAASLLFMVRTPLGFGYAPRRNAVPDWRSGRTFGEAAR